MSIFSKDNYKVTCTKQKNWDVLVLKCTNAVLSSHLYCQPTCTVIPLVLSTHLYCHPTCTVNSLVLSPHLYCHPTCTVNPLVLSTHLYCQPTCTVIPLVLSTHLFACLLLLVLCVCVICIIETHFSSSNFTNICDYLFDCRQYSPHINANSVTFDLTTLKPDLPSLHVQSGNVVHVY